MAFQLANQPKSDRKDLLLLYDLLLAIVVNVQLRSQLLLLVLQLFRQLYVQFPLGLKLGH